ncbi:hypothetical protein AVCANL283_02825 [Campylobacter canadensis]|uniref:Type II secretion system protein n=2 Tax=Campylobacter canadensis TaxID=449520 RepID=A0ABS7WQN1_9BACT|nr:hypothetical protein [Campylobacter canadensis]MBZ7987053.1 hypothetical protein [Campylobacter canadensis]MBZ7994667.1 hypothetical protein [Campylobacter canadensis]MBZ8001594.1 hypothetical protein [Campylobacter canadensis]MBZ8003312.1 hypothetical protein [Campylobacter canadensis]
MITAIIFIIVLGLSSTVILSTSLSTLSLSQRTYIKDQAEIFLKSASQYAIAYWLSKNDKVSDLNNKVITLYYPDETNPSYKAKIMYKWVDKDFTGLSNNSGGMLNYDDNTVRVIVVLETSGVVKDLANIRLVDDFTLGN